MKIKIVGQTKADRQNIIQEDKSQSSIEISPNDLAWLYSRPSETNILSANYVERKSKSDEIKNLDLPVNEFLVLNLEIECTIIEREIFTSINNHVIWAQTSRVQNILEFEIDEEFYYGSGVDYYEDVRARMIEASKTERQDDYRLMLPLVSMTKFSTSISIRNLIKLSKYFHHLFKVSNQKLFYNSFREISSIYSYFGYYENHTANYKLAKILCEDFKSGNSDSVVNNNFMIVSTHIPIYLRAHLVRHRGLTCVDDLFDLIMTDNLAFLNLSSTVNIQAAGTIDVFQEVVSKRACWVAQFNIWSDFLNKVQRIIPEMKLPCSNGACPFSKDVILRYEGKDPNPPCPIHCTKNNLPVTRAMREGMYSMIKSDKRDTLYWGDFVRATTITIEE